MSPEPKRLPGSIRITRDSEGHFTVRITDELSGCIICDACMDPKAFAFAVTAVHTSCDVTYFGSPNIGKRREHKYELAPRPGLGIRSKDFAEAIAKAAEPFEVDDWRHEPEHVDNHHKHEVDKYRVSFVRWVEVEEGEARREEYDG